LRDEHGAAVEVEAGPPQGEQLAAAEAEREPDDDCCLEAVTTSDLEEAA